MAHSYEEDEPSMERHIHYNKRGELQMVGQKSLFDLDEPVWHADEKVCSRERERGGCVGLRGAICVHVRFARP